MRGSMGPWCFLYHASALFVIVAALLVFRLAAYIDAQGAIEPLVGGGEDHAEESVASAQVVHVVEELLGERVGRGAHREREKRLVRVQARVLRVSRS